MELYIEGTQVDLDEKVQIQMVKQLTDVYDPSKIKNDHSRTITIPNTPNNNKVFGKIWSVDKTINYNALLPNQGKNFNPSKKANFILYENGTVYEKGYLKLNEILFEEKKNWRYSITLFGERGDFLSKFDDTTLFEHFNKPNNSYYNNTIKLDQDTIYNMYNSNTRGTYVDYIESEDGIVNDNFDKIEWYPTGSHPNDDETKELSNLGQKYTQHQVCNRSVRYTRFGVYMDKLINELVNSYGYTLNKSTDWFNIGNKYNNRLMVSSPINKEVKGSIGDTLPIRYLARTSFGETGLGEKYYDTSYGPSSLATNPYLTVGTQSVNIDGRTNNHRVLKVKNDIPLGEYNINIIPNFNINFIDVGFTTYTSGNYCNPNVANKEYFKIVFKNNNGNITDELVLVGWDTLSGSLPSNHYKFRLIIENGTSAGIQVYIKGVWTPLHIFFNTFILGFKGTLTNSDFIYFGITIIQNTNILNTYTIDLGGTFNATIVNTRINNIDAIGTFEFNTNVISGITLKLNQLLPDLTTKETFFSYIKLFGLIPVVNEDIKEVSLLTRDEYFNSGKVLDWDSKFDLSSEHSNTPLAFKDKYIGLSYNKNDTDLGKTFKDYTGQEYGGLRLDTGINYNDSVYELFKDVKFTSGILAPEKINIFGLNSLNYHLPQLTNNQPTLLFRGDSKIVKSLNKPFDLSRQFLFANDSPYNSLGWRHNFRYYLKFKVVGNWYKADGSVSGIDKPRSWDSTTYNYTTTLNSPLSPTWSLDISQPTYLAYDIDNYPTNGTIYKRIWEKYLLDRYSVNTRIFEGHFYLSKKELATLELNNFIWFKNKYWVIDKIEYSLTEEKLSKVRLVSVNDRTNYTNGINLSNTIDNIGGKE